MPRLTTISAPQYRCQETWHSSAPAETNRVCLSVQRKHLEPGAKLTASDATIGDGFGLAVSMSGDVALVGAWRDSDAGSRSGSAYVYRFNGSSWSQEQKLTASDAAENDRFGVAVSVSGDVALVAAYGNDHSGFDNPGAAYVYRFNGSSWSQEQKLTASDAGEFDRFGLSV